MRPTGFLRLLSAMGAIVLLVGCEELDGGGGAVAVPEVKIRVAELDDDDVATEPLAENKDAVPVLAPSGEAIVSPERRAEIAAEEEARKAAEKAAAEKAASEEAPEDAAASSAADSQDAE